MYIYLLDYECDQVAAMNASKHLIKQSKERILLIDPILFIYTYKILFKKSIKKKFICFFNQIYKVICRNSNKTHL